MVSHRVDATEQRHECPHDDRPHLSRRLLDNALVQDASDVHLCLFGGQGRGQARRPTHYIQ